MTPEPLKDKSPEVKRTVTMIHIGRKAPKGWKEISTIHLGNNVWVVKCEKLYDPLPSL